MVMGGYQRRKRRRHLMRGINFMRIGKRPKRSQPRRIHGEPFVPFRTPAVIRHLDLVFVQGRDVRRQPPLRCVTHVEGLMQLRRRGQGTPFERGIVAMVFVFVALLPIRVLAVTVFAVVAAALAATRP